MALYYIALLYIAFLNYICLNKYSNPKKQAMKKIILPLLILALGATSFKLVEDDKSKGTVEQMEGLYVFIQSKPVAPNEYLGSEKKAIALTGKPEEMLNSMIRKAKKDYPQADGIIFTSVSMDKADVIKFK